MGGLISGVTMKRTPPVTRGCFDCHSKGCPRSSTTRRLGSNLVLRPVAAARAHTAAIGVQSSDTQEGHPSASKSTTSRARPCVIAYSNGNILPAIGIKRALGHASMSLACISHGRCVCNATWSGIRPSSIGRDAARRKVLRRAATRTPLHRRSIARCRGYDPSFRRATSGKSLSALRAAVPCHEVAPARMALKAKRDSESRSLTEAGHAAMSSSRKQLSSLWLMASSSG
mmetsp:Transcript_4155/g.11722  ORF Transcript_4155/g.11722 Transcript_4155/m.11722 type:complete len:229 (-) Transcript_4155:299-985(-)